MTRRWWLLCALRRRAMTRRVDRVQAWAMVLVTLMVVCAVPAAVAVGRVVESAESSAIARESATKRAVEVPPPSTGDRVEGDGAPRQMFMPLRGAPAAQDASMGASEGTRVAQQPRVWVDATGKRTSPPRTQVDARTSGIAAGLMLWLSLATTAGVGLATLGGFLDRRRYRRWDRDLEVLVSEGGGSTASNPWA
ncbi:hypothetical protein ACN27E_11005 [Mycobacterium sp. WMMD1722]|uniref:Rv1733c family protein n=1 Tax=Mycobacterium sp. WMMD1722 TaxID=3404117 RepID=UPI003BF56211